MNKTTEDFLRQGKQLRQEGKIKKAIAATSQVIQLNRDHVPAHFQLAEIYESIKEFQQALTHYQHIVKVEQDNSMALAQLARVMMGQGDIQEAIATYQKAISLQPEQPVWVYRSLGNALCQNLQIKEAIATYQKAISLQPEQPVWVYRSLGDALYQNGQLDEARAAYQKAIEKNPKEILDYRRIDKILRELGKLEEANTYYYQGLKTSPELWEEEYSLGLRVGHVRNGILIPLANNHLSALHQGGIKTKTNISCPPYFYDLRGNFTLKTDIDYLEQQDHQLSVKLQGTYLYAGFALIHFGHYMAECTHRLWAYSKLSSQIKGVVILPQYKTGEDPKLSSFMEQAMTYMQIPIERVHLLSKATEVEHVIVPEQASYFGGNSFKLSNSYLDFLSENEKKFFDSYKPQKSRYPEKIYVSRSHLIHKGGIAGEAYIEKLLQKHENFYIFKPEKHSLYEQMNYYRHAKVCIFSEGSAIHGLELLGWLNKMSIVAVIYRRQGKDDFAQIIASRSQNLCQFKTSKIIRPLKNSPKCQDRPDFANAVSILHNLDSVIQFFRDNDLAQLKNFKLNDFYQQEAMDILKYVMKVNIYKKNFNSDADFFSCFSQFRNETLKFSQNPYLKDCL